MNVSIVVVGRPGQLLAPAIREYEERAARYWKLDVVEVKPERSTRNRPPDDVMLAEAERLRSAVPGNLDRVALTREGERWSSEKLARFLQQIAVSGAPGAAFLIGGAYGLDAGLIGDARHRLSLSAMTLPHDLARLLLAEQIYRAGTITRGEPYHKG